MKMNEIQIWRHCGKYGENATFQEKCLKMVSKQGK